MLTSSTNYTKKKKTTKKPQKWTVTLGQMAKAKLYRPNHTKKHTHTPSQKEEKKMYIYIYIYI